MGVGHSFAKFIWLETIATARKLARIGRSPGVTIPTSNTPRDAKRARAYS